MTLMYKRERMNGKGKLIFIEPKEVFVFGVTVIHSFTYAYEISCGVEGDLAMAKMMRRQHWCGSRGAILLVRWYWDDSGAMIS